MNRLPPLPGDIVAVRTRFADLRGATARAQRIFQSRLGSFIDKTVFPQLQKTTSHLDFARALYSFMTQAGIEIEDLAFVRSDLPEFKDYLSGSGRGHEKLHSSWPDGEQSNFHIHYDAIWADRSCSNPFYILDIRGDDPFHALRSFQKTFHWDLIQELTKTWRQHEPFRR